MTPVSTKPGEGHYRFSPIVGQTPRPIFKDASDRSDLVGRLSVLCWLLLTSVTRHSTLLAMIKTFTDKRTHELYTKGKAKKFALDVASRASRKLEYIHLATQLDDLKVPPGNRLHSLSGERKGQYAISINDQWRICFRFVDGDAYEVEVCDYH